MVSVFQSPVYILDLVRDVAVTLAGCGCDEQFVRDGLVILHKTKRAGPIGRVHVRAGSGGHKDSPE